MRIFSILVAIAIVTTILYGLIRSEALLGGPIVTVFSPQPHEQVTQVFEIRGHVKHTTFFAINGRRIYPTRTGEFATTLALPLGYTEVSLTARNKRGKEAVIILPIYIHTNEKKDNQENKNNERRESAPSQDPQDNS